MSYLQAMHKQIIPSAPVENQVTGGSDIFSAAARNTMNQFITTSEINVTHRAQQIQAEQYKNQTGEDIESIRPTKNRNPRAGRTYRENEFLDQYEMEKALSERGVTLEPLDEIKRRIVDEGEAELMTALGNAPRGTWSGTANFAGSLAGGMTDPVNIATMFMGAGLGSSLLRTMAIEGAIGAGTELATFPTIADWQEDLGREYGLDELAINMLFAGVGGAALGGTVRAASAGLTQLKQFKEGRVRELIDDVARGEHLDEARQPTVSAETHTENLSVAAQGHEARMVFDFKEPSLDVPFKPKPLAAAIRGLSDDGKISSIPAVRRSAADVYQTNIQNNVDVLEGQRLNKKEISSIKAELSRLEKTVNLEQIAARRILERRSDATTVVLDEYKMPTEVIVPKVLEKEVANMKRGISRKKQALQQRLDNDELLKRLKNDLSIAQNTVPSGYPAHMKRDYQKVLDEMNLNMETERNIGTTAFNALSSRNAAEIIGARWFEPERPRRMSTVDAESEMMAKPEFEQSLRQRIEEMDDSETMIDPDDPNGERVISVKEYIRAADNEAQALQEALTTCSVGGGGDADG